MATNMEGIFSLFQQRPLGACPIESAEKKLAYV